MITNSEIIWLAVGSGGGEGRGRFFFVCVCFCVVCFHVCTKAFKMFISCCNIVFTCYNS